MFGRRRFNKVDCDLQILLLIFRTVHLGYSNLGFVW